MGLTGLSAATAKKKEESSEHPNPPAGMASKYRGSSASIHIEMDATCVSVYLPAYIFISVCVCIYIYDSIYRHEYIYRYGCRTMHATLKHVLFPSLPPPVTFLFLTAEGHIQCFL